MPTEQVYYAEPYRKEIEATVVSVDGNRVVLDRTICYPEGGGQPGDRGMLGDRPILDTRKGEDGAIVHLVDHPACRPGDVVRVALDWPHRYFYMQMHAAQHLLSGLLFTHFGIGTVAIHEGEEVLTIETDRKRIEGAVCTDLESLANRTILEGHPIRYEVVSREEALSRHLRRTIKVAGDRIRLVVIDGVDQIACGGLHVADTREIALVQYVGQEEIRGHVRLIWHVGNTAVDDHRRNQELVGLLCALFSATKDDLVANARRTVEELKEERSLVQSLRTAMAGSEVRSLADGVVTLDLSERPYGIKDFVQALEGDPDRALCVAKETDGRVQWAMMLTGRWRSFDFPAHRAELLGAVNGKGGGRAPLYQGSCSGPVSVLFEAFRKVLA